MVSLPSLPTTAGTFPSHFEAVRIQARHYMNASIVQEPANVIILTVAFHEVLLDSNAVSVQRRVMQLGREKVITFDGPQ